MFKTLALTASIALVATAYAGSANAQRRPPCGPTFAENTPKATGKSVPDGTDPNGSGAMPASADPKAKGSLETADNTDCPTSKK